MSGKIQRFYKTVSVEEGPEQAWGICLDGKRVKTPGKKALALPTRPLAEAIAQEWATQAGLIRPQTMALMALASTAIDRVAERRETVIGETAAYGGTDLLCYRADKPLQLAMRQKEAWQPLLDWALLRFDARLEVTVGVLPVEQPPAAIKALRAAVAARDDFALTALHGLTTTLGSLVLALAVAERRLEIEVAVEAAQLDDAWQAALWGEDKEALARRQGLADDATAAARFLELLQP